MASDRFMIAPLDQGLDTSVRPWLIPDKAFARLNNAYLFRGRIRKRFGSSLLNSTVSSAQQPLYSRLRINLGDTSTTRNIPIALNIGQMFSVGTNVFTVWQLGAGVTTLSTDVTITCIIDSTASPNTVTFTGVAPADDIYFYPSLPVMGLSTYETNNINNEQLIAFDTRFAYQYIAGGFERLSAGTSTWIGSDSQFFWSTNYRGTTASDSLLFVTNFDTADTNYMRQWNGATWTTFRPLYNSTDYINTCRIIIPFKNRLLLLNTFETTGSGAGTASYPQRCRYSFIGSPLATTAFYDIPDTNGYGGYIDNLATKEAIISAYFLRDRLIVFFERSTWELVYTGNEIQPFRWQLINDEFGCESTFSVVPFDKVLLGIGDVGIMACNGANVERIDNQIPDFVFQIHNANAGPERVYGIRDYYSEMVYWSVPKPGASTTSTYPRQVIAYNYKTGAWGINDDSITCFGYFSTPSNRTWADFNIPWEEFSLPWNYAPYQAQFKNVIAGNQEGFVFYIDRDIPRNAPSLQITNVAIGAQVTLTIVNNNLTTNDWIAIENAQGLTVPANTSYQVISSSGNNVIISAPSITGTYTGGGTVALVSRIDILTKQFNFYAQQGRNAAVNKVDFLVDRTDEGAISIDSYISSGYQPMVSDGQASGALMGSGTLETTPYALYPFEATQDRLWHPFYTQAQGEVIQFRIYLSDLQLVDQQISWSDFQLHAFTIYANPTSRLE